MNTLGDETLMMGQDSLTLGEPKASICQRRRHHPRKPLQYVVTGDTLAFCSERATRRAPCRPGPRGGGSRRSRQRRLRVCRPDADAGSAGRWPTRSTVGQVSPCPGDPPPGERVPPPCLVTNTATVPPSGARPSARRPPTTRSLTEAGGPTRDDRRSRESARGRPVRDRRPVPDPFPASGCWVAPGAVTQQRRPRWRAGPSRHHPGAGGRRGAAGQGVGVPSPARFTRGCC